MNPTGNGKYRRAKINGEEPLLTSLDKDCVEDATLQVYNEIIRVLPRTEVKKGLVGDGLFVTYYVTADSYII